jgi:hypothetical protein
VSIDKNGKRLAAFSSAVNSKGYSMLENWANALAITPASAPECVATFGIEGTGSY